MQFFADFEQLAIALYQLRLESKDLDLVYRYLDPPNLSEAGKLLVQDLLENAHFPDLGEAISAENLESRLLILIRYTRSQIEAAEAAQDALITELLNSKLAAEDLDCDLGNFSDLPAYQQASLGLMDIDPESPQGMIIAALSKRGVINGYPDRTFRPDNNINRAEFLKILMESGFAEEFTGSNCFVDVSTEWFAPFVCTAQAKGIVQGYGDGTFAPGQDISNVEALKITFETLAPELISSSEGKWWQKYWDPAEELEILPSEVVTPGAVITRGQMAQIVYLTLVEDILTEELVLAAPNGSAEFSIEELAAKQELSKQENESVGIFEQVYADPGLGYEIGYNEEWEAESPSDFMLVLRGKEETVAEGAVINIQTIASAEGGGVYQSLNELVLDLKAQIAELPGSKFILEEDISDGEISAETFLASYSFDGQNYLQWQIIVASPQENRFYTWAYASLETDFEANLKTAEAILKSWKVYALE
jgi:hypothetical protein